MKTPGVGSEFLITRVISAPRPLVWRAWTDPKHFAQWWGPHHFTNPVCKLDLRPGGDIHVVMRAPNGTDYPMNGRFEEITPPEKLVFSCGALDEKGKPMFEFRHTVTFSERGGKTSLKVQSRVTMVMPGTGHYLSGFKAGMTQSLERLDSLLAQG